MTPEEFIRSIYLGDRACKAILIEAWRNRVAIQVDIVSRLRPGALTWDHYADADIKDAWLVFSEVRSFSSVPGGLLPNDFINDFTVSTLKLPGGSSVHVFQMSVGAVDDDGNSAEVVIRVEAKGIHLEDPAQPGIVIMG